MDLPHHLLMGGVWIEAQSDLIAVLFHPVEVLQQEGVLEGTSSDHVRTTVPHRSFPNRVGHTHPGEAFALTLICGPVLIDRKSVVKGRRVLFRSRTTSSWVASGSRLRAISSPCCFTQSRFSSRRASSKVRPAIMCAPPFHTDRSRTG